MSGNCNNTRKEGNLILSRVSQNKKPHHTAYTNMTKRVLGRHSIHCLESYDKRGFGVITIYTAYIGASCLRQSIDVVQ